jgi:MinD superfamily P-loop ATPase
MTLSRKEFFRQGFFSLGETLLKVGEAVREAQHLTDSAQPDAEQAQEPVPDATTMASVDNQLCLARNCGCFACVERCDTQAILVVMGEGIRIDQTLCSGCGMCEYVCPVTPKALRMIPVKQDQISD